MYDGRILWIDWLKFLGIFGVIGIHISSSLLNSDILLSLKWYQGVFASSLFRFGIILFVMASGYLILNKQQSIDDVPRRVKRIILPFVFWLILYAVIKVVVVHDLGPVWNIGDLLSFIFAGFLNPTNVSVQFWYVYMILGLYILSPILRRWVQSAPVKEIEYFIWLWIGVSFLQFLDIHSILLDYLRYFTGAIGYFILGYYLSIKDNRLFRDRKFGLALFLTGTLITFAGTVGMSFAIHDQSLFFIKLGDITPGACLESIGLFIIIFNSDLHIFDENINKWIVKIAKSSYGIYLSNILVINLLEKFNLIDFSEFALFEIFIFIMVVMGISYIVISIMDKIPVFNRFSGR